MSSCNDNMTYPQRNNNKNPNSIQETELKVDMLNEIQNIYIQRYTRNMILK